ncbi:MAG: phage tail tube protein [Oscillospiraceae bacterium]
MLYSGVTGKISIKKGAGTATTVAHMASWSVELTKELIDVASFGLDYKERVPSIKDWTASSDGAADFATTSGQKDLVQAFEDGAVLEATFYLDATTFFKGDCFIESLSIEHAADGKADVSISLSGSGGVTLTVPTT